jgi:hypothetical protein
MLLTRCMPDVCVEITPDISQRSHSEPHPFTFLWNDLIESHLVTNFIRAAVYYENFLRIVV